MRAIVTICDRKYGLLLPHWLERIKEVTALPVVILALEDLVLNGLGDCQVIEVKREGNPFPEQLPEHACAEKLRMFGHLPSDISEALFVDVDVMVLEDFWSKQNYFTVCQQSFIASPDLFVGYKEKMEDEFRPYDSSFRMKFLPDGKYFYFNTGVYFASRQKHSTLFTETLKLWVDYVRKTGRYPSIFDQNVLNYALIRFNVEVMPMPIQNNCLRQYPKVMTSHRVLLDGLQVNAVHFNGGDADTKLARWLEFEKELSNLHGKHPHAERGVLTGVLHTKGKPS